jgi:hypothetical protein
MPDILKQVVDQALYYKRIYLRFMELDKKLSPRQSEVYKDLALRQALCRLSESEAFEVLDNAYKLADSTKEY